MKGRELFEIISKGEKPDRIPFVPTIYEHSAKVIGKLPSEVAKDEDLIVESQLHCYELYKHDLVSVGVDIYNIECEALGARINYYDDERLPSIKEILLADKGNFEKLRIPDPAYSGRMPVMLNAVDRINRKIGKEVIVNGTIVGPFTLAAILRGFENFLMDLLFDAEFANKLMIFCEKVGLSYAEYFIKRGAGLSINESWISPPLLSPYLYREYVFPVERNMIKKIKEIGLNNVALISGGDTASIAKLMVETGTSLLMADSNTDQKYFKELCAKRNVMLRASIDSKIVEHGIEKELRQSVAKVIDICAGYNKFVFGCGIVSFNTPPENLLLLKKIVKEYNPYK